jgi:hypothetical protein
MSLLQEIKTYGLADCEFNRGLKMDRFDYYMEFMAMRLEDPNFRLMYGINDFDKWYQDYIKMLTEQRNKTK